MSTDDDTPWEPIHDAFRRARKSHPCHTCGGQIEPGEQYRRVVVKEDGRFVVYLEHGGMCDLSGLGGAW